MKRLLIPLIAAVPLLAIAVTALFFLHATSTPSFPKGPTKVVTIPQGYSLGQIASLLGHEKVVRTPFLFKLLVVLHGQQSRLQSGEYRLSGALSPLEVMAKLVRGDVLLHRVTIPEGWTVRQVAELLAEKGLADREQFLRLANDGVVAAELELDAPSLEGYLFPETYYFRRDQGAERIVAKMLETFRLSFAGSEIARARELGMTPHEVVTLASLIEKETSLPDERPLVSAVFHNRLRRGMKLQSDPTVIYALPDFDGNLTKADLSFDSPYNTYLHPGLPPGPVANPGKAAIQAALYPSDVPYLYFVSKNDGSHHFSTSLAEQNRAVRRYQRYAP